jgi:tRNA dimethylallyltransferase
MDPVAGAPSCPPPVVAILGPTASGKSALGLTLAQLLGGEILCCDSMQVYRGMDIGTAKPSAGERAAIPHHLLDLASPVEQFHAAAWAAAARGIVAEVASRGRLPIIVGGTGLY